MSGFLARSIEDAPLDLLWWSGVGMGFGDFTVVSVPLGAMIGWTGRAEEVLISPYGGGHMALDITDIDGDNIDLHGAFDVGLDIVLSSGWLVRFGASFGDRDALAFGFRLPN